jgi:hypothetical protein
VLLLTPIFLFFWSYKGLEGADFRKNTVYVYWNEDKVTNTGHAEGSIRFRVISSSTRRCCLSFLGFRLLYSNHSVVDLLLLLVVVTGEGGEGGRKVFTASAMRLVDVEPAHDVPSSLCGKKFLAMLEPVIFSIIKIFLKFILHWM